MYTDNMNHICQRLNSSALVFLINDNFLPSPSWDYCGVNACRNLVVSGGDDCEVMVWKEIDKDNGEKVLKMELNMYVLTLLFMQYLTGEGERERRRGREKRGIIVGGR